MKTSIFSIVNKVFRLALIVLVVFLIENGSSKVELKMVANENLNRTLDLTSMALKVEEENKNNIFNVIDEYTGRITGYAADCYGCGGYLPGLGINVLASRQTEYEDKDYGTVRIVAASTNLPFGSIVRFNLSSISDEPIIAVVADRGGAITGTKLDLLMKSEDDARTYVGSRTINYEVLRVGWKR